jgi:hypothetical protein
VDDEILAPRSVRRGWLHLAQHMFQEIVPQELDSTASFQLLTVKVSCTLQEMEYGCVTRCVLTAQRRNEPFQDCEGPVLGGLPLLYLLKERGLLSLTSATGVAFAYPIRTVLCETGSTDDEAGGGERADVAAEIG